ncbi:glycoside hydrolase family 88 protein [Formosa sp. S-31]
MKYSILTTPVSIAIISLFTTFTACKTENTKPQKAQPNWAEQHLEMAANNYKTLSKNVPVNQFPTTYTNDTLRFSDSGWWCSGFYPGTLVYLFEGTQDSMFLKTVETKLTELKKEQYNTTTHDLGFMMFCSYGNAYQVTHNPKYAEIIKNASQSISSRFNPKTGTIRSWDPAPWNDKWEYPVIIDNMMNLEMLLWAGKQFNNHKFTEVALTHADTTLNNHFRKDFSSYHVVSYDTISGNVEMKNTDQGYADESSWARGQAWGLYGYTTMYRYTKNQKYLEHAMGIADFIVNHPNLPENKIPYWDFDAPNIPNAKRDASAAAIMASAFLELKNYASEDKAKIYFNTAEQMLKSLSSPEYFASQDEQGGFIIKHCVGNMPDNTEVDVPLSYADYYYVEALLRYLNKIELIN